MWKLLTITIFAIFWAINASEELDKNQLEKTVSGCGHTLTKLNGAFELNNHTMTHYWTYCYWNISSPNDTINLFFLRSFLLEEDSLTIYKSWEDAVKQKDPLIKNPIKYPDGTNTLITNEKSITIALIRGKNATYDRILEGYYTIGPCTLPVKPDIDTLYPPSYMDDVSDVKECIYEFNKIQKLRGMQVFTFEEFNMPNSTLEVVDGTFTGEYKKEKPTDFFTVKDKVLEIHVKQQINSTDYFKLKIHTVDSSCSGRTEIDGENPVTLKSPQNERNNGTIIYECRWLFQHKDPSKILGFNLDKSDFHSVFDIASVNDGASELSTPLFQITTSNKNTTQNQRIRSSASSLWVAFKPVSYESRFDFNVTVHGQGGYLKNEGKFTMHDTTGDDTAFLLEVDSKEVVMLTFDSSSITPPATVSVYDGFESDTNNLLTTLRGQIKFPIFSRTSRMMVTGTHFGDKTNQFSAKFRGVIPSCNHTSSLSTENYVLSQNCNSSCVWVIPPQDKQNSALIVYLQFISLKLGDNIKIHKLDSSLTQLGEIGPDQTHVPHFSVPADVGILINVTQSNCVKKEDKVVLIGHSSYIPACSHDVIAKSSESLQISSPLYPDTYPLFTDCHWNITGPNESIIHLAFQNLNLAINHCIKISQVPDAPKVFEGSTMPSDLFLKGNVFVDFDSSSCNKSAVSNTLNSDSGFLLNVTVADCGAVLDGKKSGEFNTNITGTSKSLCIWKVSVPPKDGDSVNILSYVLNKKDSLENYELDVYDGPTVRDAKILNSSDSGIWSRTNTLIFVYKRLNVSKPSSTFSFKYNTISCNKSMQCDNGICMHPNWICNGANECGDYSDERKCAPVPIPPEVKSTGYTATAFWLCCIALLIIGVIFGVIVPIAYQRYKDSQYRRFHELGS